MRTIEIVQPKSKRASAVIRIIKLRTHKTSAPNSPHMQTLKNISNKNSWGNNDEQ